MLFITYWALTNLIIYSYLQEKVPWLVLNILLPLTISAGAYISSILEKPYKRKIEKIAIGFLILSSIFFVYSSIYLNFYDYTNPGEILIQAAQPPQRFSEFLNKINEIASQYNGYSTEIQVTDVGMETQFLWYLRHYTNVKWRVDKNSEFDAPLIVVHDTDGRISDADVVKSHLKTDYERLDSAKMSWYWFKTSDITPEYILYKKINRHPGEYRVVLFYKPKI